MKHLIFDMMYSYFSKDPENTGEIKRLGSEHPQKAMRELGITYQHATPQSIADQWWFWNCENIPNNLPPFLYELTADPMECIGWGLNEEMAVAIRDYEKEVK